jgi:Ca2+-transporting ATPase
VRAVVTSAALNAAVALGTFVWALRDGATPERARTYVFALLVFSAAFRCFVVRSATRTAFEVGFASNRRLVAVAAATLGVQLFIHHGDLLRGFLRTSALTWTESLALLALAAVPATLIETAKLLRRLGS